jgi:hypothetical protein
MKVLAAASAFAGLLILAGCVSVQQIPMTNAPTALQSREISLAQRDKPDFGAMTPGLMAGGALFGAIGGAIAGSAMVSAGNQIVAEHNLTDPAELIGPALASALSEKYSARVSGARPRLSTDDAAEAAKAVTAADAVLDIRTINWGLSYIPNILRLGSEKYRVNYTARGRLIDKQGKVLAEGGCVARSSEDGAPTYAELLADAAARLKQELTAAADQCAQQLATRMFGLEVGGVRRDGAVAHAPSSKPPAVPVAAAAPAPAAEQRSAVSGLPAPGTVFNYSFRDRVFSSRNRDFSVQLAAAAGASVTEIFAARGDQQTYSSNSQAIDFVVRRVDSEPVYELAPYLLAHLPAPSAPPAHRPVYAASGSMPADWNVRIEEVRPEPVQVPAGRFDAVRLRVVGENPTALHSIHTAHAVQAAASDYRTQRFEYTVWYVPEIGRYVQSRHQTFNRYGHEIGDEWVQLSSIERPR